MADVDPASGQTQGTEDRSRSGWWATMPRWVRVFLVIGVLVLVAIVVMLLSGHGPAQHMNNGSGPYQPVAP
jgi:hypothetical protein